MDLPIVKKTYTICRPLLLVALMLASLPVCYAETQQPSTTILAKVNGTAITARDLESETAALAAEMRLRNHPPTRAEMDLLRSQLVENLIERELLYQHARKNNISIRSQWVETALSDLKAQLGGTSALQYYLAASDQTTSQLKDRLRSGLTVRRLLRREAVRTIKVSEAEMQAFYRKHPEFFERGEQIRVRHILVSVGDWNDETQRSAAWKEINDLKMRIDDENDFAVLALRYSDCPSSVSAGDLGYLTRAQMVEPFAAAAFETPTGAISDIFSTRFGYHLIQVMDRAPAGQLSYKDAREKIERSLRRDKENTAVKRYVAQLKRQAQIERFGGSH